MLATVLSRIVAVTGLTTKSPPTTTDFTMSIKSHVGAPFDAKLIERRRNRRPRIGSTRHLIAVWCHETKQQYRIIVRRSLIEKLARGKSVIANVYHPDLGRAGALPAELILRFNHAEPGLGATTAQLLHLLH